MYAKTKALSLLLINLITVDVSPMAETPKKQLRLHFDINKTIIATDAVQGKELETTINGILAEFTFAKWNNEYIQSYYAYVTEQIAQENPHLSRASEAFKTKRSERLKGFPHYLAQHPELLARYEREKAAMIAILSSHEMVIFPSFYKTVAWLNEHFPKEYALYLRTFGTDLPVVVPTIERNADITFTALGAFHGPELSVPTIELSVWDFFTNPALNHYALRDDYSYWKSQGFQATGGKPFPIDLDNHNTICLFFDDNANDPDKPIIHPFSPDGTLHDTQNLLDRGNIVAVNPKEAILDEDYFINKIKALITQME